ncbi:MAG TPA: hypothetical protein PKI15_00900 [Candidatus Cloacimonadota bacterium]|nr:hypothetical protein [Candidatus Cloacimonadota bacterium]
MRPFRLILLVLILLITSLSATVYKASLVNDYAVFYTSVNSSSDLNQLAAYFSDYVDKLQMELGIYTDGRVPIYVVPDKQTYHLLSRGKDEIVEFSDAFYSSTDKMIYIRSYDQITESYQKVLIHEYIHWYLDQILTDAPLWFHEGMATYYAGQMGYERYLEFMRNRFWGKDTDIFLQGYAYPEAQTDWSQYYLSSYFALQLMRDKKPEEWKEFWNLVSINWHRGYETNFVEAFNRAYLTTLWDFSNEYSRYSKRLAYQYLAVAVNALLLSLLPFVLLLAYYKRRKRRALLPDLPIPEDDPEPEDDELEDVDEEPKL